MAEQGGNKMNKFVAILLTILFALSVMGCATTHDRDKMYEQLDTMRKQEAKEMRGLKGI